MKTLINKMENELILMRRNKNDYVSPFDKGYSTAYINATNRWKKEIIKFIEASKEQSQTKG